VKKAAVLPTDGAATAEPSLANAFLERLRQRTVLGRLNDVIRRVPPNVLVPRVTAGAQADWRDSAGRPLKVSRMSFDRATLNPSNLGVLIVTTQELERFSSSGLNLVERDLLTAAAFAEDEGLLGFQAAVADGRPAGLLNGLLSTGEGSPFAVEDAVAELIRAVRNGESEQPVFVASRYGALYLATQRTANGERIFPDVDVMRGGSIMGIPLLLSPGAETRLIHFDAATILVADDGVEVTPSTESTIEMSNTPTGDASTATASSGSVSLFQANAVALRCIRSLYWLKGFSDSVAFVSLEVGSPS
jgi:HK97 family phage major capsid protein